MDIRKWLLLTAGMSTGTMALAIDSLNYTMSLCVDTAFSAVRDKIVKPDSCDGTPGTTLKMAYYRDGKSIGSMQPNTVTKGIIVIHGLGGEPTKVRDPVWNDVKASGLEPNVWVVAPYFIKRGELSNVPDDVLQWVDDSELGYQQGDATVLPAAAQVSSFDVLDALVRRMKERAPSITEFVVMGHSAGGQTVLRYSMGTKIEDEFVDAQGKPTVNFRYVISSPGTYTYLSGLRYNSDEKNYNSTEVNKIPPTVAPGTCTNYNKYRFGLEGIPDNHYMKDLTVDQIRQRIADKKRLFIVATNDSKLDATDTCEEKIQGAHRRVRAHNYMHHLRVEKAATNAGFCLINGLVDVHTSKILGTSAPLFYWRDSVIDCSLDK